MDELIQAMSNDELEAIKTKHSDNPSILTLIDGILETRVKEAEQVQAKAKFTSGITKLFDKLPHPEDIYNVVARWSIVDEVDTTAEPEEVEIVETPAEVDKDGKIITPAVMVTESRQPTVQVSKWIVETNKGITVRAAGGGGNGEPKTSKRAITVKKIEGDTLIPKGNFASASKACEHLKLTIGGDSATRVLSREGYMTVPYEGTDFTS